MCDVTAAVVAGTAIAGAAASSSSKKGGTTTSTQKNEPWAPQAQRLNTAFEGADQILTAANNRPAWEGFNATTAATSPQAMNGAQYAADFSGHTGKQLADQMGGNSGALMAAGPAFANNARGLAANGAGAADPTARGVLGGAAEGALTGSAGVPGSTGLSGQIGALSSAQALAQRGMGNLNPSIIAGAEGYMNSDLINGQVTAATRDVARTLGEETLPGLNARAVAGGNLNSARAGVAEGIARRGAEDRAGDMSTAIRNNAFNTGIEASLQANQQQNALALGGNQQVGALGGALSGLGENQRQFDVGTRLQGATTLGTQDLANRQLQANTQLNANAQLGNASEQGMQGALATTQMVGQTADGIAGIGTLQQAEQQRQIDQNRQMYYADELRKQQTLASYYGIVGGQNWGGTQAGTQTAPDTPANPLGGAMGGALAGLSMTGGTGAGGGSWAGTSSALGSMFGSGKPASTGVLYK